jgi:hypothetical protein
MQFGHDGQASHVLLHLATGPLQHGVRIAMALVLEYAGMMSAGVGFLCRSAAQLWR